MANAIVLEVLEFVRPIRLQVEHIALAESSATRSRWRKPRAEGERRRCRWRSPSDVPPIQGDPHQLRQLFTNLLTNAFEALEGRGDVRDQCRSRWRGRGSGAGGVDRRGPMVQVTSRTTGPACRPK